MNQEMTQQLVATAERLASAAETLDRVLERLDAQQEALNAKVDRIVAAVEERGVEISSWAAIPTGRRNWRQRVAELEKANMNSRRRRHEWRGKRCLRWLRRC